MSSPVPDERPAPELDSEAADGAVVARARALDIEGLRLADLDDPRYTRAWDYAYAALNAYVRGVLRAAGVRPYELDDAALDVWIALHRTVRRMRHPEAFVAWVRRAAQYRARTVARAGGRADARAGPADFDLERVVDPAQDQLTRAEVADGNARLRVMLSRLDATDRETWDLRIEQRRSTAEIADYLGLTAETVRGRRKRLAKNIRALPQSPDHAPRQRGGGGA